MRRTRRQLDETNPDYPPDLLELKRRLAARGVSVRLPKPGAVWIEAEPLELPPGVSLSDIVIRNHGGEP